MVVGRFLGIYVMNILMVKFKVREILLLFIGKEILKKVRVVKMVIVVMILMKFLILMVRGEVIFVLLVVRLVICFSIVLFLV